MGGDTRRPSPSRLVPPRSGGQHLGDRVAEEVKLPRNKGPSAVGGGPTPHLPTLGCTVDPLFTMVRGKGQRDERRALLRHPLTELLHSSIPEQVPPIFSICPLPPTRCSWLISLLRSQPLTKVLKKEPTRSTIWLGRDGQCGYSLSSYLTTSTLPLSNPGTGPDSLAARFSGPAYCQLAACTVSDSVNHVAASFVEAGFPGPRLSEAGAPSRLGDT
jgi:hypothetical protein